MIQDDSLNVPPPPEPPSDDPVAKEFEPIDSGSELEEDGNVSSLFLTFDLEIRVLGGSFGGN